jgi:hypothetical protein
MVEKEVESVSIPKSNHDFDFSINKKLFFVLIFILLVLVVLLLSSFFTRLVRENIHEKIPLCGDGSFPGTCSLNKPYYCNEKGVLGSNPETCGCPEGFDKREGFCSSKYQLGSKNVVLNYTLNGEKSFISYTVYGDFNDYLYSVPQSISYSSEESSSRADFKLNKIDNEMQKEFLVPLVVGIQNLAKDKDDQARIAISLVQNIPFGESNYSYSFGNQNVTYSRFPYQVLYEVEGVCGEKTELLAFLLRELGYGVSFFYYADENHESLGIKCPVEKSFSSTGYCFVETTAPSIITDDKINYVGVGKLNSIPQMYFLSKGYRFGESGFYEYKDAKRLQRIRRAIENRG